MKRFFQSIFPPEFYTNVAYFRTLLFGLLYIIPLLAQLFTFEKFKDVLDGLALPGSGFTSAILLWLLPLLGVLSLPAVLSMRMSNTLYAVSRTAVVALPLLWVCIGVWSVLMSLHSVNSGLLGATIVLPVGIGHLLFAVLWAWAAVATIRTTPKR